MPARRTVSNTAEDQALKGATRKLMAGVGGVEAAEGYCRVGRTKLSDYGRPDTDAFIPADVIKDLESNTHGMPCHPVVTRFLARQQGFALVKLPTGEVTTANVHKLLGEACRESNDVITGALAALENDHISPTEARDLQIQCIEGAEAFMRFHALLAQISGEP